MRGARILALSALVVLAGCQLQNPALRSDDVVGSWLFSASDPGCAPTPLRVDIHRTRSSWSGLFVYGAAHLPVHGASAGVLPIVYGRVSRSDGYFHLEFADADDAMVRSRQFSLEGSMTRAAPAEAHFSSYLPAADCEHRLIGRREP